MIHWKKVQLLYIHIGISIQTQVVFDNVVCGLWFAEEQAELTRTKTIKIPFWENPDQSASFDHNISFLNLLLWSS
jgi:hypothetical protein